MSCLEYIATIHCHIQILTTAFAGKGWESFSISELIQAEQGEEDLPCILQELNPWIG